jgi:hypothetical protein
MGKNYNFLLLCSLPFTPSTVNTSVIKIIKRRDINTLTMASCHKVIISVVILYITHLVHSVNYYSNNGTIFITETANYQIIQSS